MFHEVGAGLFSVRAYLLQYRSGRVDAFVRQARDRNRTLRPDQHVGVVVDSHANGGGIDVFPELRFAFAVEFDTVFPARRLGVFYTPDAKQDAATPNVTRGKNGHGG